MTWPNQVKRYLDYKPFYDRYPKSAGDIGESETVWLFNDFVPPGKHHYFILFKIDDHNIEKRYFTSIVKLRQEDIQRCKSFTAFKIVIIGVL